MNAREKIEKIIEKAIKNFTKEIVNFSVEIPDSFNHGDYSTNVALVLSKKIKKSPVETANLIKSKLNKNKLFKKVEVAGPGFINFFIADKIFIDLIKEIIKKPTFAKDSSWQGKKVIIDYTDPNILKEFHIGHLMNNSIGESLSRIFEFQGAEVKRVCYQSDVGISVAKAVWGILQDKSNFPEESDSLSKKIQFLSRAYVSGSEKYESDENAKKEIIELNKKIFSRSDKQVNNFYDKGKKWSLEYFDQIYKKLGTKFDWLIFESQVANLGKKIVEKGLKNKIFEKGENKAVIFKGENYGLHTRVFINSEGLPTYEAKDLGLAETKYKKYAYDKSVIVTGNEVNDYFKVMLCAMSKTSPKLAEKTKHIGHGMLRLSEGKMASRTGKAITGESLINEVKKLVEDKIKDRSASRRISDEEKNKIIEKTAIGAIKYSILRQSIGSDIIYDFNKSISFEGDSGPYLQYSYTRAKSVLKKAKEEKINPGFKKNPTEISRLEKTISYFQETVLQAGNSFEPHFMVLYLTKLAAEFNNYYAKNRIVDRTDNLSAYRVALTASFSKIMEKGLWMLGIETLDKM